AVEVTADQRLDLRGVEVADGYDGHQLRAIPGAIKALQRVAIERADAVRRADRQPLGITGAAKQDRQMAVPDARGGALAAAPFLEHDAAFELDLFRLER